MRYEPVNRALIVIASRAGFEVWRSNLSRVDRRRLLRRDTVIADGESHAAPRNDGFGAERLPCCAEFPLW